MKELDNALKLQAYVDGELPDREAKAMAKSLSQDAQRQVLHDELRSLKALLRGNEIEHPVRETREFYWSQIQRSIAATPAGRAPHASSLGWWLRWLVPVGATALLCAYWLVPTEPTPTGTEGLLVGHELETPLAETTSYAFRSESAGMTVVWVETRGLHNLVVGE
jgi:anti-sigma factor RsiW